MSLRPDEAAAVLVMLAALAGMVIVATYEQRVAARPASARIIVCRPVSSQIDCQPLRPGLR